MDTSRNGRRRTSLRSRQERKQRSRLVATWVAGIVATVVATVLTGIVTGWLNRIPGVNPDTPPAVASSSSVAEPGEPFTTNGPPLGGAIVPAPSQEQAPTGELRIPATFAGTWSGHIVPTPAIMSEEDIRIVLTKGQPTASWEEPTEDCTGTLLLTSVATDTATFILQTTANCVSGTVTLTRKVGRLAYRWMDPLGVVTYTGDLQRS